VGAILEGRLVGSGGGVGGVVGVVELACSSSRTGASAAGQEGAWAWVSVGVEGVWGGWVVVCVCVCVPSANMHQREG
jgi:hypothetical protein